MEKLKKTYNQWLNDTDQHEIAAAVKEKEGDTMGAINLYLRANIPIRASKLLMNNRDLIHNQDLVSKIATALIRSDLYENVAKNLFLVFVCVKPKFSKLCSRRSQSIGMLQDRQKFPQSGRLGSKLCTTRSGGPRRRMGWLFGFTKAVRCRH